MAEEVWKDYREELRKLYGRRIDRDSGVCNDQLQSGALMRIADAMEIMTKDKDALVKENFAFRKTNVALQDELKKVGAERDNYKNKVAIQKEGVAHLYRRISALRGVITRLKKRPGDAFIRHIKGHLERGQVVICKICGKSADRIIAEAKGKP